LLVGAVCTGLLLLRSGGGHALWLPGSLLQARTPAGPGPLEDTTLVLRLTSRFIDEYRRRYLTSLRLFWPLEHLDQVRRPAPWGPRDMLTGALLRLVMGCQLVHGRAPPPPLGGQAGGLSLKARLGLPLQGALADGGARRVHLLLIGGCPG
jgi:hypothetical protein